LTTAASCFRTAGPSSLLSRIPRPPEREIPAPSDERTMGVSTTDGASQNREYVRRLLDKKQPEFAAVLDRVVWELTRTCDAPSAESAAFEHDGGGRSRAFGGDVTGCLARPLRANAAPGPTSSACAGGRACQCLANSLATPRPAVVFEPTGRRMPIASRAKAWWCEVTNLNVRRVTGAAAVPGSSSLARSSAKGRNP